MQFTGKLLFTLGDNMSSLWQNNWIIRAFIFCRSEIRVVDPSLRLESAFNGWVILDKTNSGCEHQLAVLKNECYPSAGLPNVCGSFLPGNYDLCHERQSVLRTQSCIVLGSIVSWKNTVYSLSSLILQCWYKRRSGTFWLIVVVSCFMFGNKHCPYR